MFAMHTMRFSGISNGLITRTKVPLKVQCITNLPKTENQNRYSKLLNKDDVKIVIAIGPAGTGKTLMGCSYAVHNLLNKDINKIVITRPTVSMGEDLGFLPGRMEDKMHNWLMPIYDSFSEYMQYERIPEYIKNGKIEIAPLSFIRGRTFHNSWIIVDEAQNISKPQMKTLLTRIGQNSKMILTGDLEQCDIEGGNGLEDFVWRLKNTKKQAHTIQIVEMTKSDIMRSDIVKDVLYIYDSTEASFYFASHC